MAEVGSEAGRVLPEDAAAAHASWGGQGGGGLFDAAAVRVLVGGACHLSLYIYIVRETLYIYISRERLYLCDYMYVYIQVGVFVGGPRRDSPEADAWQEPGETLHDHFLAAPLRSPTPTLCLLFYTYIHIYI